MTVRWNWGRDRSQQSEQLSVGQVRVTGIQHGLQQVRDVVRNEEVVEGQQKAQGHRRGKFRD